MKIDFKKCMMAVAMSLAVTGAIASKVVNLPVANENEYSWTRTGGEPLPEEQNPFVGTKTDAQNYFGCSGTYDECAVGTSTSLGIPPEVIYQH